MVARASEQRLERVLDCIHSFTSMAVYVYIFMCIIRNKNNNIIGLRISKLWPKENQIKEEKGKERKKKKRKGKGKKKRKKKKKK